MITLAVKFCLVLNPYLCQTLELWPTDGSRITTLSDCLKAGAIGSTTFVQDHMEWRTHGWYCRQTPTVMQTWINRSN